MLSLIYLIQAYSNKNMFFSKSRKSYQLARDHLGTYVKNRLVFLEMNVKKHILTKYPKGRFLSESVTIFLNCQTNMPNHYLKLGI